MADFRRWFAAVAANGEAVADAPPSIDLAGLLGHYVALRQEVNLQTRSVRAQQEQNAELVANLREAVERLSQPPREAPPTDHHQRALLTTLVELYDALSLATREIGRMREGVLPLLEALAEDDYATEEVPSPTPPEPRGSWLRRMFAPSEAVAPRAEQEFFQRGREALAQEGARFRERVQRARETSDRVRGGLAALITGYAMSLDRVERALRKHGLEPFPTLGEPFDPERMEVLEVVPASDRPAGEVVGEVRRGYLWNGRVFRFAQVRVARG